MEIDDDEEEAILDEEELDDVEPDVDPKTNEVDDVEPTNGSGGSNSFAALREQEALIRSIDKHQVTVSITPKSSVKPPGPKQPAVPDSVSVTAVPSSTSTSSPSALPKVQYVRRPDGKGFVRKVVDPLNLRSIRTRKKKKKKAFRGINYRFDGSRIKKRVVKKASAANAEQKDEDEQQSEQGRDQMFLEYLGIQRKDSTDSRVDTSAGSSGLMRAPGQKAKKSFKVGPNQFSR